MLARLTGWARRTMPTREAMARSRWVPGSALERSLWRFTRRSVPRGVALGMLVGILIPVAQIVFAAILCLPVRANVPVAALVTFITNPFTTPLIWAFSYQVGAALLRLDAASGIGPIDHLLQVTDGWTFLEWLTSEGRVLALGLVVVAVVAAAVGYLMASFGWRWWILRQRKPDRAAARGRA